MENTKIEKLECDIFSSQKFNENAKNGQFREFLKTVLPDRFLKGQKMVENAKIEKFNTVFEIHPKSRLCFFFNFGIFH